MKTMAIVLAASTALLLAACGGGGGAPKTVAPPAPVQPAQPKPTPAPSLTPSNLRSEWESMSNELNGRVESQGNTYLSYQIRSWPTTYLAYNRADQAVGAFYSAGFTRETFENAKAAMARFCADYARVKALKAEGRGHITAPGIDRIPLSAVKVTKSQMARMFVVEEGGYREQGSRYGSKHIDGSAEIACHS